ncbi:PDR/VanB family oxidoreductase [Cupriavidus sp. WKF15]|uniref:PDR/VanB family oxidoreductase n=1 Tax=Cupriavidus sp. WKF15 TaxID=3032282 RepID=UPI0023E28509|nr:PDR/VanB family oxidoreductase [Cupriavidus sp. WKF15]WER46586.1 PDR/VanB family oxidoreductase [Cupriavidus sp. WKF15]
MKKLNAILHAIEQLADGILGFEFRPTDGQEWPMPTAGAHVDVHLPNGLVRSYSLTNRPGDSKRYLIAVNREASGTGGSRYMHDLLRVGQKVQLSEPRNNFPLSESGAPSVFIAGGIGITPIWSMVQRLSEIGAPWCVHYSARTREGAAFVDEFLLLASRSGGTVHLNFDGGMKEKMLDLQAIVESSSPDCDFYCCGPVPMLRSFTEACKDLDQDKVHLEYFAAPIAPAAEGCANDTFSVVLSKSDKVVEVGPDSTILEALLAAGVDAPYSCMGGVCRACETGVIAGTPDHRDFVLSDAEKLAGDKIIICCSRAKSQDLVLDL